MKTRALYLHVPLAILALSLVASCASGPPQLPYPAFVDVNELDNVFLATLPGTRARRMAGDPRLQSTSNRVILPPDWQFTSGASPLHSVEIFVLAGELTIGEFRLTPGGYAYIPSGTSGASMRTENGAVILYFLDGTNAAAVIQTPLISSSEIIEWLPGAAGMATKELRADPGSGARTWLQKIESGAVRDWSRSNQSLEGYLLSGVFTESECDGPEAATAQYLPGGYFQRPAGAISGGPLSGTEGTAIWFLRTGAPALAERVSGCVPGAN